MNRIIGFATSISLGAQITGRQPRERIPIDGRGAQWNAQCLGGIEDVGSGQQNAKT